MGDSPLASLRCKSRCGRVRQASARLGMARWGPARSPLTISALRASTLSAGFLGIQIWRGGADPVRFRLGAARWGWVWLVCGKDCRRQYGGLRPSLLFFREQAWQGRARSGLVRYGWVRQRTARQQRLSAEGFGFPAGFQNIIKWLLNFARVS